MISGLKTRWRKTKIQRYSDCGFMSIQMQGVLSFEISVLMDSGVVAVNRADKGEVQTAMCLDKWQIDCTGRRFYYLGRTSYNI